MSRVITPGIFYYFKFKNYDRIVKDEVLCIIGRRITVSIRRATGIEPLYIAIATVTMNLLVAVAIVLLNLYVTACISYQIHSFVLSVHIPDVSTSICVEVDSITVHGQPFYNKAFVQ